MNKFISVKLKILSLLSIILVVYLHADTLSVYFDKYAVEAGKAYNILIQFFVVQGLTRIAVPMFFLFSGYLFSLKFNGTLVEYAAKLRKRIKTLLVPYLFWSLLGILIYFIVQLLPFTHKYFYRELISEYSFMKFLETLFINPIPYQLWFMRDLFVLVVLSPLIYFGAKRLNVFLLFVLLIMWYFNFNFYILSVESLFFYTCGVYFTFHSEKAANMRFGKYGAGLMTVWLVLVFIKSYLLYLDNNSMLINIAGKTSIIVGIPAIWAFYDSLASKKDISESFIYRLSAFSFFIYVFHEPMLTLLKKILISVSGKSEFNNLIIFFIAPVIAITISVVMGYFLRKTFPVFYERITGGR